VRAFASQVQTWYLVDRKRKRFGSKLLRAAGLLTAAAGAIFPLTQDNLPADNPFLGYVLLAIAGSCYALDRAMGLSSGWARDMEVATAINKLLSEFRFEWIKTEAEFTDDPAGGLKLTTLAGHYEQLFIQAYERETHNWVAEFQDVNKKLTSELGNRTDNPPARDNG
jgi:hypothetical protein